MENPAHVDGDLNHLFPPFRQKIVAVLSQVTYETAGKYAGLNHVAVYEGYRSAARQKWLYAQGRTRPGNIVTNDPIPHKHGYLVAADIVGYDHNGNPSWNWPAEFWQQLRHAAHTQGLESGLDWPTFPDPPHVQESDEFKAEHMEEIRAYAASCGLSVPAG